MLIHHQSPDLHKGPRFQPESMETMNPTGYLLFNYCHKGTMFFPNQRLSNTFLHFLNRHTIAKLARQVYQPFGIIKSCFPDSDLHRYRTVLWAYSH